MDSVVKIHNCDLGCGVSCNCRITFRKILILHQFYKDSCIKMYLRYYMNEKGERQYTLSTIDPYGKPTISAHPARFSPEDKYSRQRITIKKRFGLLLTQQPEPIL